MFSIIGKPKRCHRKQEGKCPQSGTVPAFQWAVLVTALAQPVKANPSNDSLESKAFPGHIFSSKYKACCALTTCCWDFWWNPYLSVCLLRMSSHLCLWYVLELAGSPAFPFHGENSPATGCSTAVFSQSHRMNVVVPIHHSISLVSNLLIVREVTMPTWNNRPEEKCIHCLTGLLDVAKATGSDGTVTTEGTQDVLAAVREAVCTRRQSGIWWEGNGLIWWEEYPLQNVDSLFPSYPSKPLLVIRWHADTSVPTNTRLMVQWEHFPALICLGLVFLVLSLSTRTLVLIREDGPNINEREIICASRNKISLGRCL